MADEEDARIFGDYIASQKILHLKIDFHKPQKCSVYVVLHDETHTTWKRCVPRRMHAILCSFYVMRIQIMVCTVCAMCSMLCDIGREFEHLKWNANNELKLFECAMTEKLSQLTIIISMHMQRHFSTHTYTLSM